LRIASLLRSSINPGTAKLKIGNRQSEIVNDRGRRIVSQGHDKVFTLKLARKRLFRPLFALD
jgi:plasmid stabilization system protein ParE